MSNPAIFTACAEIRRRGRAYVRHRGRPARWQREDVQQGPPCRHPDVVADVEGRCSSRDSCRPPGGRRRRATGQAVHGRLIGSPRLPARALQWRVIGLARGCADEHSTSVSLRAAEGTASGASGRHGIVGRARYRGAGRQRRDRGSALSTQAARDPAQARSLDQPGDTHAERRPDHAGNEEAWPSAGATPASREVTSTRSGTAAHVDQRQVLTSRRRRSLGSKQIARERSLGSEGSSSSREGEGVR